MNALKRDEVRLVAVIVTLSVLLLFAQSLAASENSTSPKGDLSPSLEFVSDTFAFIRWNTANPGGTILHYAIVQYGTDPDHLDRTAKSPTRINPTHGDMIFRVRVNDLRPATTYYYRVLSQQANGASDPGMSAIERFTTRTPNAGSSK